MPDEGCTWLRDHPEAFEETIRPAHLETCETCRAQVEGLERLLRHGLRAKEVPVPPELAQRIEAAVAAKYGPRRVSYRSWLLAAAALALALGAVLVFRWPKADQPAPIADRPVPSDHRRSRELPTRGSSDEPPGPAPARRSPWRCGSPEPVAPQ
jgi:hypothetical protein